MKTKLFYASFLFVVLACGPASNDSESLSGPKASDDINSLDRTPGDRDQLTATTPPVRPAPEAGNPTGNYTHPNAPPSSILSKPYFDDSNMGGVLDVPNGTANSSTGAQVGNGMQMSARLARVVDEPGLVEVTLTNTGSGWQEKFLLFVPVIPAGQRAPLLVVFHRFGVSHWDAYYWTQYIQQARQRKWFLVAPLGASQVGFSSLESQINTQAALDFTTSHFNINRGRVYGVGFSMGGGAVTNYAARHLDPDRLMFAAVVNHTGGVSLANTWASEYDDDDADDNTPNWGNHLEVPDMLEAWYGGSPSAQNFNYQRCSTIDLDPATEAVGVGTDLSRNVAHIPIRNWMADNDPLVYLREQTLAFDNHVRPQNAENTMTTVSANIHKWETLNFAATCNWLSQFNLELPTSSSTLADQDGKYFWFDIQQEASGAFTPFNWIVDSVNNRVTFFATSNLTRAAIDVTRAGLSYSGALKVNLNTSDGTGDQVLLTNVPYEPLSVTRDGAAASGVWDSQAMTYLIDEPSNTTHMWRLNF